MRYCTLGKSGLRVSELVLGTMSFGNAWEPSTSEEESRRMITAFIDAGGNFFDTADKYMNGQSEETIGKALDGIRDRFVIGTKYTLTRDASDPNAGGNQRKNLSRAVEASLRRLRTDFIDVYWVHALDELTPVEEVLRSLDDLVRSGKVLYIGVSNAPAWWVAHANTLAELRGWSAFTALQIRYSLLDRTAERELIPMARHFGIGLTSWAPLAGGALTGKYSRDPEDHPPGARLTGNAKGAEWLRERHHDIIDAVRRVAEATNRLPAEVGLAWLRQRGFRVLPIVGARNSSQLRENLRSLEVTLEAEHVTLLDRASQTPKGYPHDYQNDSLTRALIFGETSVECRE